jgi:hypothetical protein
MLALLSGLATVPRGKTTRRSWKSYKKASRWEYLHHLLGEGGASLLTIQVLTRTGVTRTWLHSGAAATSCCDCVAVRTVSRKCLSHASMASAFSFLNMTSLFCSRLHPRRSHPCSAESLSMTVSTVRSVFSSNCSPTSTIFYNKENHNSTSVVVSTLVKSSTGCDINRVSLP